MYYANAAEMMIDANKYMFDIEEAGHIEAIDEEDYAEADDMACHAKAFIMNGYGNA